MVAKFGAELIVKLYGKDLLDGDRVKPGAWWSVIMHCRQEFTDVSVLRFGELICIVLWVKDVYKVIVFVEEELWDVIVFVGNVPLVISVESASACVVALTFFYRTSKSHFTRLKRG